METGTDTRPLSRRKYMTFPMSVFAYLGPETMLPMTSIVAAVIGVVMLSGRATLRMASGMMRGIIGKARTRSRPPALSRRIGKSPVGRDASPAPTQVRLPG
jgi:hypothetical protein